MELQLILLKELQDIFDVSGGFAIIREQPLATSIAVEAGKLLVDAEVESLPIIALCEHKGIAADKGRDVAGIPFAVLRKIQVFAFPQPEDDRRHHAFLVAR